MAIIKALLIVAVGYLLGSVSVSILLSKGVLGGDVREKGSGNAGATNMARIYGLKAGVLTLAGDSAKAAVSVLLGWRLMGDTGIMLGGIACMLGHCFPVYYRFRGGKGVSVGAALALAIDWRVFVSVLVVFALVSLISKKVSLASVCSAMAITVSALIFKASGPKLLLACAGMALCVFQHRENIFRLMRGIEPVFKAAKKKEIYKPQQ